MRAQRLHLQGYQILPGFLHHSCAGVRAGAAAFAAAAARQLSAAEAFVFLVPKLSPALASEPASLASASSIISSLPQRTAGPSLPSQHAR